MVSLRSPRGLSQRGRLGFLLKDAALYGSAAALSKAFSLITFPLIARHFSTTDYGLIDFFGVLATFFGILTIFGQDSAVARFFYVQEEVSHRQRLISQSLFFQLAIAAFVVSILWLSAEPLSSLLVDAPHAKILLQLVALQTPFLVLMNFSQNLLKWTFQRNQFLIVTLGSTISAVLMVVVGVLLFDIDVKSFLLIGLFNSALFSLLGLWFVRKWLIVPNHFHCLRELLVYAMPLGFICSVGSCVPAIERWIIADFLGVEELGLYAAGMRIAVIAALFSSAFQTAWGPFSISLYKEDGAILTYNSVLKCFTLAMVLLAFLLAAAAYPLIVLLATDRYANGVVVVFPLMMGLVIQASGWIVEIGIGISKRSYLNLYSYAAYVVTTIICICVFAKWWGIVGVAFGVLVGHLAKTGVATVLAQYAYPMAWEFYPVLILLSSSIAYGNLVLWLADVYGPLIGIYMFTTGFAVFAVSGPFLMFSYSERASFLLLIKGKASALEALKK